MDVDNCWSPPAPAMAISLSAMSVDKLSNWLEADGGIPNKFCEVFVGKLQGKESL